MFTIRFKLVLGCSIVFAILMGAIALNVYESFEQAVFTTQRAHIEQYAEKLSGEIEEQRTEGTSLNISEIQKIKPEGLGRTLIRLIDTSGNLIYTDSALIGTASKEWSDIVSKRRTFETVRINHHHYRSLWTPVEVDDRLQYALQVASSLEDPETSLDHLRLLFLSTIPIGLVLFALAVNLILNRGFKSINNIIHTAQRISGNRLNERVTLPKGRDEVYDLAATLNDMLDRLDASFRNQKQFIADASHEIRTPLTILTSEIEFAYKRIRDKQARESLTSSLTEIEQLNRLVSDLLALARLDASSSPLALSRIRLDSLLWAAVRRMDALARLKKVKFLHKIAPNIEIEGDEEKLGNAFCNLIDNAIKFSHRGGAITVRLEVKGTTAVASIHDDGVGISEADLPLVFNRFHRGEIPRAQMVGYGLGLAIVKTIIDHHKGSIGVESEIGKGATFIVVLPIASDSHLSI